MMVCGQCKGDVRVMDTRILTITTPTGKFGHAWRDVHPRGSVTGRVETKRVSFPETIRKTLTLCPGCAHKVDIARRRGLCTVTE